jgi:hypothetical protein
MWLSSYSLFSNTTSSLYYILSKGGMIREQRIGKYSEGSGHVLIWDTIPAYAWRD